jgi:4-amino-4-deoxy-L-arabinose transferase-like glycosyltransferase
MSVLKPQIIVPILALVFVLLAAGSASRKSLTWDEPTFITSGYTYLDKSDFRLNPEAPPLLQKLVALPLWLGGFAAPNYEHPAWQQRLQVAFAKDYVIRNRERIEDLAFWARLPIWIVGGCLVIAGGAFCAQVAGPSAAVICACLMALSPNLLAHGRLATTDLGCAALMFGSVWCFRLAVERNRPADWGLAGIVTGLALLAKYTALLLGPAFIVFAIYEWRSGRIPLTDLIKGAGILVAGVILLLFIGYDLAFGPSMYLDGLSAIYSRQVAGYKFYLLGEVLDDPVWYYYPVAFLLKTPEPTLCLIGIAVFTTIRSPALRRPGLYLLTPAALILGASFFDQANLGLRRILPVYPFLFAFIAIAGSEKPCRLCKAVTVGLVIWAGLAGALAYPHYLSYFNVLSGGSVNAPYLLDDSNVDWGQDLPALAEWQSQHPDQPIKLRYFGTADPSFYGVRADEMPDDEVIAPKPGIYAISAHNLVHFRKIATQTNRPGLDWLDRYEPFDRAGASIYLYRSP